KDDTSKSNLIGTSLFADGAAAALIVGKNTVISKKFEGRRPTILDVGSTMMKNSLDVMGWDVKDRGLYVIFSKNIPYIVNDWLNPVIQAFLNKHYLNIKDIQNFILHPGGKKVIQAYEHALGITKEDTEISMKILREYGNMSSPTVLYVLQKFLEQSN